MSGVAIIGALLRADAELLELISAAMPGDVPATVAANQIKAGRVPDGAGPPTGPFRQPRRPTALSSSPCRFGR